jgi:predicted dehydrogenase
MDLTRRDFTKIAGLGFASRLMPQLYAAEQQKTGYAVIGLGTIADHFMRGSRNSSNSQITALVSGHRDKAERIAAEYGIASSSIYSYEEFDRIAA